MRHRHILALCTAVSAFGAATLAPVAAQAALTAEQEAAVVRAVQAKYGDEIMNPAIDRIEAIRQEQGYVTATVHFAPDLAEGRHQSHRVAFCRQGATLEVWNCVHSWEDVYLTVPDQHEPVWVRHPAPDELVDALIAYVRALPGNSVWPVQRDDVAVISSVNVAPSGNSAQVMTSAGYGVGANIGLSLCDPDALARALASFHFQHPGARSVCGLREEQVPRTAAGQELVTEGAIAMPTDGSYLLVHYEQGYGALRVLGTREVERRHAGEPLYRAQFEVLYSEDGNFETAIATTVETTNGDGPQPQIELPGLMLESAPPDSYVAIAQFSGILAAAVTSWQDRRLLDASAPSLDWYYIRTDHETHVWSAQHLPVMSVNGFERFDVR